jgi:hypothetical protein
MLVQKNKKCVDEDGQIWLPEKNGCPGGWYPLANPDILTDDLRWYRASGWGDGVVTLKRD